MPLPPLHLDLKSSSEAYGGSFGGTGWNQGDQVVSFAGDARSDRTAPAVGSLAGAMGAGSLKTPLVIAAAIVLGALLWKRSR